MTSAKSWSPGERYIWCKILFPVVQCAYEKPVVSGQWISTFTWQFSKFMFWFDLVTSIESNFRTIKPCCKVVYGAKIQCFTILVTVADVIYQFPELFVFNLNFTQTWKNWVILPNQILNSRHYLTHTYSSHLSVKEIRICFILHYHSKNLAQITCATLSSNHKKNKNQLWLCCTHSKTQIWPTIIVKITPQLKNHTC